MAGAALLDWVIDPLADHVDADAAPRHAVAMRAEMERVHRAALAAHRATYGRGSGDTSPTEMNIDPSPGAPGGGVSSSDLRRPSAPPISSTS